MNDASMLNMYKVRKIEFIEEPMQYIQFDENDNVYCNVISGTPEYIWSLIRKWDNREVDCNMLIHYLKRLSSDSYNELNVLDFPELFYYKSKSVPSVLFKFDLLQIVNMFYAFKHLYYNSNEIAYSLNDMSMFDSDRRMLKTDYKSLYIKSVPMNNEIANEILGINAIRCSQYIRHEMFFREKEGIVEAVKIENLYFALIYQLLKVLQQAQEGYFNTIGICQNRECQEVFEVTHANQRYCPKCRKGKGFDAIRKAQSRAKMKVRDAQNAAKE